MQSEKLFWWCFGDRVRIGFEDVLVTYGVYSGFGGVLVTYRVNIGFACDLVTYREKNVLV
jgi:hypothetical protein